MGQEWHFLLLKILKINKYMASMKQRGFSFSVLIKLSLFWKRIISVTVGLGARKSTKNNITCGLGDTEREGKPGEQEVVFAALPTVKRQVLTAPQMPGSGRFTN